MTPFQRQLHRRRSDLPFGDVFKAVLHGWHTGRHNQLQAYAVTITGGAAIPVQSVKSSSS